MSLTRRTIPGPGGGSARGSRLKWKLALVFFALMALFAIIAAGLCYGSIRSGIVSTGLECLRRNSKSLIDAGENYYMGSITKKEFESRLKKFHSANELVFVLFTDNESDLLGFAGETRLEEVLDELKPVRACFQTEPVKITVGGSDCLTILETTHTTPPYTLYIGIDSKQVEKSATRTFFAGPVLIIPLFVAISLAAMVCCFLLLRPYERLEAKAERISLGDLNVPLELNPGSDASSLSRSFDRMRQSVRYALERLERGG